MRSCATLCAMAEINSFVHSITTEANALFTTRQTLLDSCVVVSSKLVNCLYGVPWKMLRALLIVSIENEDLIQEYKHPSSLNFYFLDIISLWHRTVPVVRF